MRLSIPLEEDQFDSSSMYSTIDSLGQPGAVRKGRVIRPFLSGFDPDFVVHGNSQLLLTAEVMLGRLDGHVPEQELDLVELSAGQMTEAGTGAPQLVGRQLIDSGCLSRFLGNLPRHFRRHAMAPYLPDLLIALNRTFFDSTCLRQAIDRLLHPEWNGNRPNMPGLAVKVGNHPMLFTEWNRIDR
jgi:hypothetical protein